MDATRSKVLVLAGQSNLNDSIIEVLKGLSCVVEAENIDKAIDYLRHDHFDAVFSDAGDFLPLERALVSQQANVVLNTIGEGVCVIDGNGRCNWMNKRMSAWPLKVHEKISKLCQDAFNLFSTQVSPPSPGSPVIPSPVLSAAQSTHYHNIPATPEPAQLFGKSKRYAFNNDEQQFLEMIVSPVITPAGKIVQVAAVIWDATGSRRLQQKIDAIDNAGGELVRLEGDALGKLTVPDRLKLLEEKIIRYTRDLMNFDHFAIRLLDRKSNRLELVMSCGLPEEARQIELFCAAEGNGISGFVAATGRSYICPETERDPRYVLGLDQAKSSLTVPLRLEGKVIGIFNIESRHRSAFNEDDRQFAEIFGRYVAIALNILNLLVSESVGVALKVADDVYCEVAGPLNDIVTDASSLMDEYIGNDELRAKLKSILDNTRTIQQSMRQAAEGPNTTVLGTHDLKCKIDPILTGKRVLIADDEPNLRTTLKEILRKYGMDITVAECGGQAISIIEQQPVGQPFDLILSDIKMPDKSGYDVFAAARKHMNDVPVILMTGFGYDPNHSIVRASQEGLQAVLFKPFKVDQLVGELHKALGSRSTESAL